MESLSPFSKEVIERLIVQMELFQDFLHDEQEIVLQYMDAFLRFQAGEKIVKEGQVDDCSMYLLLSGRAAVTAGDSDEVVLDEVHVGDFFGEISFLTESPRTANVVAVEPCIVWRVDHELLKNIPITLREKIKDKIIQKLVRIITHSNQQLKMVYV
jgi:CRP-like cAMP-binding protein